MPLREPAIGLTIAGINESTKYYILGSIERIVKKILQLKATKPSRSTVRPSPPQEL